MPKKYEAIEDVFTVRPGAVLTKREVAQLAGCSASYADRVVRELVDQKRVVAQPMRRHSERGGRRRVMGYVRAGLFDALRQGEGHEQDAW